MTIEDIFTVLWNFVNSILEIELPVGQYDISFWNILITSFILYIVLKVLFGLGTKGGEQ